MNRSNKTILILFTLMSFFLLSMVNLQLTPVAGQEVDNSSSTLKVVTSVELLEDFVTQIGGNLTGVTAVLVDGTEDPHTYEPTQSEINALIEADVLLLMGRPDLEPWWEGYTDSQGNSEGGYKEIVLQDNPDLLVITAMNESMAQTDPLLGMSNPHGWMSPIIAKQMVKNIYLGLNSSISEDSQILLKKYYTTYINQLDTLITYLQNQKSHFSGLKVVVHHPSFMYLFDLLGIERIAVIEEQHDVEPSPQHIQEIKSLMETNNCTTIVSQANLDEDAVVQLARDMNANIIWGIPLLGMESKNGTRISSYINMIHYNIWALDHPEPPTPKENSIPGFLLMQSIAGAGIGIALAFSVMQFGKLQKK
ncbi:MAG: metal ABC transporter substrate-binding protein [Promethearchaeota archaeon]